MEKPRSPAPPAEMQEKLMVFTNFQAAVRSAAKTSKAFPRPLWTCWKKTFTILGGCGGVQGGGQGSLRASWEPKVVPKTAFWSSGCRLGPPPMLWQRFQKH